MSESVVDVSYRGLALARRVKLTRVQITSGYVETPGPMPVGTTIAIGTDEGLTIEAVVTAVHEQVTGTSSTPVTPGMQIAPKLEDDAVIAWWGARIEGARMTGAGVVIAMPAGTSAAAVETPPAAPEPAPPTAPDAPRPNTPTAERLTVRPRSHTVPTPPPEGAIPDAAEWQSEHSPAALLAAAVRKESTGGHHPVVDDGRNTSEMAAVDPEAVAEDADPASSGPVPAADGGEERTEIGSPPTPGGSAEDKKPSKKKRGKRRN